MNVSPYGIAFIKHFENCRLKPYLDAVNLWTLGWGRRITEAQAKQYWGGIPQALADQWFVEDLGVFAAGVSRVISKPVKQNEFDAVVSLAFNIGLGAFDGSTMLVLINEGKNASAEFIKWSYAGGHILPGLKRRRQIEANAYDFPPSKGETPEEYLLFICSLQ